MNGQPLYFQQDKVCPRMHISPEMWNQKSVCLSLSPPSLAVGEGCYCSGKWESLYKYSQGFLLRLNHQSTVTVQPEQLRVSSKPESRLTGEGVGGGSESSTPRLERWVRDFGSVCVWGGNLVAATHRPEGHKWGRGLSESSVLMGWGLVTRHHIKAAFQQLMWLFHERLNEYFDLYNGLLYTQFLYDTWNALEHLKVKWSR